MDVLSRSESQNSSDHEADGENSEADSGDNNVPYYRKRKRGRKQHLHQNYQDYGTGSDQLNDDQYGSQNEPSVGEDDEYYSEQEESGS